MKQSLNLLFKKFKILLVVLLIPSFSLSQVVRFGVIADIHEGYLSDVETRLQIFIDHMNKETLDFVVHLGDFSLNPTTTRGEELLAIWDSYKGKNYHVLGNHDMDRATKAQTMSAWKMSSNYYSFDLKGFRFVILDGNHLKYGENDFRDYANGNYFSHPDKRAWFGPQQLDWFKNQMDSTELHMVSFSHQQISSNGGGRAKDAPEFRKAIDSANSMAGYDKFMLSLNGHGHDDLLDTFNIPYVEIPTAAHLWKSGVGAIPYTTVRFAIVTIDANNGTTDIDGFSIPFDYQNKGTGDSAVGEITSRSLSFTPKSVSIKNEKIKNYEKFMIKVNEGFIDFKYGDIEDEPIGLSIYDISGKKIWGEYKLQNNRVHLSAGLFKTGWYYFKITRTDKEWFEPVYFK